MKLFIVNFYFKYKSLIINNLMLMCFGYWPTQNSAYNMTITRK